MKCKKNPTHTSVYVNRNRLDTEDELAVIQDESTGVRDKLGIQD